MVHIGMRTMGAQFYVRNWRPLSANRGGKENGETYACFALKYVIVTVWRKPPWGQCRGSAFCLGRNMLYYVPPGNKINRVKGKRHETKDRNEIT
ncbi:hypothetical protein POVCU2_0019700 [Plasmodium ovale curtisi]|uniref:Uncharacterized protein n=1 Tax=Plasmodium ovale curtisi TaxID=864141 RepID=A0A1A8VU73_PLAOA|nr:hypothetical protein POVCU2_0019700 [Plasmodium ovale curtisi]SBS90136.1 hypothetical protein POVCU1_017670 [Plasmodium ovale curtisi]